MTMLGRAGAADPSDDGVFSLALHGQGVLNLLYTGRDDAIAAFPITFISSSARSV